MVRSDGDKKGIRGLARALLEHEEHGPPVLARVREARPGNPAAAKSRSVPCDSGVHLTKGQRQYLEETVAKEHWKRLSREQQVAYSQGLEVADCPFLALPKTSETHVYIFERKVSLFPSIFHV